MVWSVEADAKKRLLALGATATYDKLIGQGHQSEEDSCGGSEEGWPRRFGVRAEQVDEGVQLNRCAWCAKLETVVAATEGAAGGHRHLRQRCVHARLPCVRRARPWRSS